MHPQKTDETVPSDLPAHDEAAFAWTLAVIEQSYRLRKPDAHQNALRILAKLNLTVAGLAKRAKARRKAKSPERELEHIERLAAAYQDRAEALGALIETVSSKRTLLNEDAGPTAETIMRPTRRDPIEALYAAGHLSGAEVDAARQIAEVYEALTKPLFASAQSEMPIVKAPKKAGRRTNAGMPDWIAGLRATVYLPWARDVVTRTFRYCRGCGAAVRALEAEGCPRCGSTSIGAVRGSLPLVLDVVVDGLALNRVRQLHRMGDAKARAALAGALRRYVEIRNVARRGKG